MAARARASSSSSAADGPASPKRERDTGPASPKRERDAGSASPTREREGGFVRRVLGAVTRIPPGRVATYGDIAALAGRPGAARAVGNILARASRPGVPYHRVIAAGGALGGYSDLDTKRALLASEGHRVTRTRVQHFNAVRWAGASRRR